MRLHALIAKKAPSRKGIFERGGERMFGRNAIVYRKGPDPRRAPRFCHQPAMARKGSGAIAAAMKEKEHARSIASGRNRPFGRHAAGVGRMKRDVAGGRPDRAHLIDAPRRAAQPTGRGLELNRARMAPISVSFTAILLFALRSVHLPNNAKQRLSAQRRSIAPGRALGFAVRCRDGRPFILPAGLLQRRDAPRRAAGFDDIALIAHPDLRRDVAFLEEVVGGLHVPPELPKDARRRRQAVRRSS